MQATGPSIVRHGAAGLDVGMSSRGRPTTQASIKRGADFGHHRLHIARGAPGGVVLLELPCVADPPDVVSTPVGLAVRPGQWPASNLLAQLYRLQDRAVRLPASTDVVHGTDAGSLVEMPKCADEIGAMDIVANLLALVPEYRIRLTRDRTFREIREEPVKLGSRVSRTREAPSTEADRLHPEVAPVFLDEQVRRRLRHSKKAVRRLVDAHRFVDSMLVK